ncbi:putative Holliday junction resolvase domain protein, partial [Vibrio parahaemolyticus V-223/04]|jgi:hypothetical protein
MTLA